MCCCSSLDPKFVVRVIMRISLGLSLAFIGFTHFSSPDFALQVGSGLGALESIGVVWGYVLPGLMVIGGVLLTFGIFQVAAASIAGIALASIPAGLLLKSAMGTLPLESSMPAALNALIWLIVLFLAIPRGSGCCVSSKQCCAEPSVPSTPVRTTPPVLIAKSAAQSPLVHKTVSKKTTSKKVESKKTTPVPSMKGGLDV